MKKNFVFFLNSRLTFHENTYIIVKPDQQALNASRI